MSVLFDGPLTVLGTEIFLLLDVNDDTEGSPAIFDPPQSTATDEAGTFGVTWQKH